MMRFTLLLLAVLPACAGENPFAPRPAAGVAFQPRAVYAEWYVTVERCAGLRGDFSAIHWWVVGDSSVWYVRPDTTLPAMWSPPHDITLGGYAVLSARTDSAFLAWRAHVVQHESLHDLLRGDPFHLSPLWNHCNVR